MKPEFVDDISSFLKRLKRDSEKYKGHGPFEDLMRGLSDGSIDFKWGFGGRFSPHTEPSKKPDLMWLRWLISAPLIYAMIIPVFLLDIIVSLYQAVCFRLWKLPQVQRSKYVVIDHHKLEYLNVFKKIHCSYCGYANGVMSYARIIAGETELYWCPVERDVDVSSPHNFYIEFADYDDPEMWNSLHSTGISNWGNSL